MVIELPEELEAALKAQANAHGVSPAGYVREVLERELAASLEAPSSGPPFKTVFEQGLGLFGSSEDSALLDEVVSSAYEERRRPSKTVPTL